MYDPVNHSYFFGINKLYDWGNRSFFSYYGEFGRSSWFGPTEAGVLFVVFVCSVAANAFLALVILRYKELRTVTNYFILNLALADILFASSIPFVAIVRITETWILGEALCRLLLYFQFVCGSALLWTLTFISLERYRCIVLQPMRSRLNRNHALGLVLVIWGVSMIFFIPVALWFVVLEFPHGHGGTAVKVCTLVFPNVSLRISYIFIIAVLLVTCLVPIAWLVFNYYSIFRKLLANERRWQLRSSSSRNRPSSQVSEDGSFTSFDQVRNRKHYRTVKILLLDVCITIIMWSPIIVMMGLIHYDSSKKDNYFMHSHYFIITLIAALSNTCVNPLLYGFLNTHFRVCLDKMLSSVFKCRDPTANANISFSTSSQAAKRSPGVPLTPLGNVSTQPMATVDTGSANTSDRSLVNESSTNTESDSPVKSASVQHRWHDVTAAVTKYISTFNKRLGKVTQK